MLVHKDFTVFLGDVYLVRFLALIVSLLINASAVSVGIIWSRCSIPANAAVPMDTILTTQPALFVTQFALYAKIILKYAFNVQMVISKVQLLEYVCQFASQVTIIMIHKVYAKDVLLNVILVSLQVLV